MDAHPDPVLVWSTTPGDQSALLDAGRDPSAEAVQRLLKDGQVKVRLAGTGPDALAAASVYAWLGVAAFETTGPGELRQVLDMVAAIKGERPPAVGRRALA